MRVVDMPVMVEAILAVESCMPPILADLIAWAVAAIATSIATIRRCGRCYSVYPGQLNHPWDDHHLGDQDWNLVADWCYRMDLFTT
jgi:hypothetical protein